MDCLFCSSLLIRNLLSCTTSEKYIMAMPTQSRMTKHTISYAQARCLSFVHSSKNAHKQRPQCQVCESLMSLQNMNYRNGYQTTNVGFEKFGMAIEMNLAFRKRQSAWNNMGRHKQNDLISKPAKNKHRNTEKACSSLVGADLGKHAGIIVDGKS